MGNRCVLTVVGAGLSVAEAGLALVQRLDALWSRFRHDSDITVLNLAEGEPRHVDPLTCLLIGEMIDAHRRTRGDFDPTLLPALVNQGYVSSRVDTSLTTLLPTTAEPRGDLDSIRIDDNDVVIVPRGTTLDPGGIGKGLAADLAVAQMLEHGGTGALAQIGGEVVVLGTPPDGEAWLIGVEDPFHPDEHCDVVRLLHGAVATSSTRKLRWKTIEGEQVHHLMDPRSGRSVRTDVQTVTVIAGSGAHAEALTKPGFLRPLGEYLAWLPTKAAAALVVTVDGVMHTTANWSDFR